MLHDPQVDRAGKSLVALLVVRGLVAAGASAGLVVEAQAALHALGL